MFFRYFWQFSQKSAKPNGLKAVKTAGPPAKKAPNRAQLGRGARPGNEGRGRGVRRRHTEK